MTDDAPRHLPAIVDASPTPGAPHALPDIPPLEFVIALWLDEQRSPRTRAEYAVTLSDFRAHLARVALDLDCGEHRKLAELAQVWSKRPNRQRGREGLEPSSAMIARRLAILSSFYLCAIRHGLHEVKRDRVTGAHFLGEIEANPLRIVKRPSVQRYADAQPMEPRELMARLRRIDRATVDGQRDYALLSIALTTGRRIAELAGMRADGLRIGRDKRVTVRWETKGAKVMRDHLDARTSAALLAYLSRVYPVDDLSALPASAPVWLSFSRATTAREWREHAGEHQPMTTSGLRRIFLKRIGTSKAHATRHSFALLMEQAGASLTDIQARLGHASTATTAAYMNQLKSADNPYSDRLAALLGLE